MKTKAKQNVESKKEEAKKTSEKLAEPLAPIGLGAQIKLVATAHEKYSGKKSWVAAHSIDITLGIGLIWCILKIIYFFYAVEPFALWLKFIETFIPAIAISLALLYRIYPTINIFNTPKKRD